MILLLLGAVLLILVLRDVFQSVWVPRGKMSGFWIAPLLVRKILWPPFRLIASKFSSPVWSAEVLGLFAPFTLMILLTTWIFLIVCAFGFVAFALADQYSPHLESLATAFYVSGSSVLTLGSAEYLNKTNAVRFLMLAAAFSGMIITATVVSFLFTLIASIQRREVMVSLTSNISGSPPTGIAILETYAVLNGRQSLASFYEDWHRWCADISDTHKAYPILPYFRSNDAFTSWLTALGAALDSTALLLCIEPATECFSARLMYRFGCRLVVEMARSWNVEPKPSQEITDSEFDGLCLRLQTAGYCANSKNVSRETFLKLRQEYAPAHHALCQHIAVPQTPLLTELTKAVI